MHAHRAVLSAGQGQREVVGLAPGERTLTTSKLFFAYALEHSLLGPLAIGATALLDPEWPEAEPVLARVAADPPAAFFSVPTFYRRLLALGASRLAPFRRVRRFVAAGERLPAPVLKAWRAATGGEILSLYGMSETFCACLVTPPGSSDGVRTGKPLGGVGTRLVTADGREAQASEPGILWVRHPALALGYANLPERTAAQFQDGWFCSQDFFVRDGDGFLSHQGRSDELVKIAGQWVQPAEVEETVAQLVVEVACVPIADQDRFERLALFIAPRGDAAAAVKAAEQACEKLPPHKRPKWIVPVRELPRTPTGKVQRFKLREQLEEQLAKKS
jgi:benzoate-CoA ligase